MKSRELAAAASRLSSFVEQFASCFGRRDRRHWCKVYLSGLVLDGERKSIEPMATRVRGGNEQALQQFVNQSPWDDAVLRFELRRFMCQHFGMKSAIQVLDDTTLPKKGEHSVGVAHQYCGALGKLANCQTLVTLQAVGPRAHFPLAARLYLPKVWTDDVPRMNKVGVPEDSREFKEKWRIALDLLDEVTPDCHPEVLLFDAGYGGNRVFLRELDDRRVTFVGQTRSDDTFWSGNVPLDEKPRHPSGTGRPRKFAQSADKRFKPRSIQEWGRDLFSDKRNIKRVKLKQQTEKVVEFVAMRAYEAIARPFHTIGPARWVVIERLGDGTMKYYVSNHGAQVTPKRIVRLAHERWKVEQGYQQLKEELGLDHFEGRSWRGLHHHVTLCFMAFDFLQTLARSQGRGKKEAALATGDS